ncbi:hypothetical protein HO173_002938 [Letharia columbiana]|uniref:Uncharacterized protein n=1 Tax=Letharia columbiana TaxID=112416 RepID=A0A8H6G1Z2_9LECA|nr:uncharacterized protein HO173_002938 [Letharia columbiana]KAF6239066.1 hypothetical protein HO173_002938 [Letharia columbiana]
MASKPTSLLASERKTTFHLTFYARLIKGTVMRNVSREKPRNQSSKAIVSNSNDPKNKEPQKGQPIQEYLRK